MYDDSKLQAKCDRGKAQVEAGLHEYSFRRPRVEHKYPEWMRSRWTSYGKNSAIRRKGGAE